MANYFQVVSNCTLYLPQYGQTAFVAGQQVAPNSPYYNELIWSGLATDTGLPGPTAPIIYPPVTLTYTGTPSHDGDILQWDQSDGEWEVNPEPPGSVLSVDGNIGAVDLTSKYLSKAPGSTPRGSTGLIHKGGVASYGLPSTRNLDSHSMPIPQFARTGVVASVTQMTQSKTTIGYPWVIKLSDFMSSPPAPYLGLVSTDHDPSFGGIWGGFFDYHGGPWRGMDGGTSLTKLFQHPTGGQSETPCILYNPNTGQLIIYYQVLNTVAGKIADQVTCVNTLDPVADPTLRAAWTYRGISHDWETLQDWPLSRSTNNSHTGYQHVCIINGVAVSRGLQAGGGIGRRATYLGTKSWLKFHAQSDGDPGNVVWTDPGFALHLEDFILWNGQIYGFGRNRNEAFGTDTVDGTQLVMGLVNKELNAYTGRPQAVFSTSDSGTVVGENGDIRGFNMSIEDGVCHLYYASDKSAILHAQMVAA